MKISILGFVLGLVFSIAAQAGMPRCYDDDNRTEVRENNEQVLGWKKSTKSGFKDRALVVGKLVRQLKDRKSHLHLVIDIGDHREPEWPGDQIELIYNKDFGGVGSYQEGDTVAACGDYITSNKRNGRYDPSPMGAILHWIHKSTDPDKHPSGFLMIEDDVYGLENPSRPAPWMRGNHEKRRDREDRRDRNRDRWESQSSGNGLLFEQDDGFDY